ncbi:MAG: NAD(P)-dependent oxidoreductase [Bacteroidales bacterium]|nr:NAD(P)-dependent oxidoreductase [Bacteroidales bacterium]
MKTKIGWIGLGNMGTPMSMRIIEAGYPVTVYNRTKGKEEKLISKGASVASSPLDLMKQSDVVVIMVSDDQAVREIFLGDEGLLNPGGINGKIIINMSTVSAGISVEMAALCRQGNHHYLDAPVSGSVKQAETGTLVVMAGGEETVFNQVKPILDILSKLAIHVGGTGSGNTMKLAVNVLLGIISQGLSEAVIFAQNHGLEAADLIKVIENSAIGSVYMKIKGDAILQNNYQAAFAIKHIAKDLRLAKAAGLNTPLGEAALDTFQKAEPKYAGEDIIAIIKALQIKF